MLTNMFTTAVSVTINDDYNSYGDDKSNNKLGT